MTEYSTHTDYRSDVYRSRVLWDEYGFDMEPDLFAPFVKIERYGSAEGMCSQYTDGDEQKIEEALVAAIDHYGTDPSDSRWHLVERYMRVFWNVPELHTFYSDGIRGWYVATYKDVADEYENWVNGEVFTVVLEELREVFTDRRIHSPSEGFSTESSHGTEWVEIESVGGFIGSEYAESEAKEMLTHHIESEIKKGTLV